jgi:hypothetical protein
MRKTSAPLKDILDNLDPDVIEKGKVVKGIVQQFKSKLEDEPKKYKVADYNVTVEANGDDLRVSCTCKYWVYQGPEYHAKEKDYLYGTTKGTETKPEKKDPNGTHKICKHIYAVLEKYFGA